MKLTIEKIREAISASGVNIDAENMPVDVSFESLGLDSLDFYNVILEVQLAADCEIPDEDVANLQTIQDIHKYINRV